MSFSMFIYLVSVAAAYKLGAYGVTHPDGLQQLVKTTWGWMNK